MEYFLGAVITLATIFVVNKIINKQKEKYDTSLNIEYSQTNVFELIRPFLPEKLAKKRPTTQGTKHYDKLFFKVFIVDDQAYWIKENTFYTAEVIDGEVDQENATPVDTMGMDKVQLDKMIFIVEKLTKGN